MKYFDIVVLTLHVLGATVWTGGHLVLSLSVLPRALSRRAPELIRDYEDGFERIGLPALALQLATGLWMLYGLLPQYEGNARYHAWGLTSLKTILLLATVALAMDAKLRLLPKLGPDTMRPLARHIVIVTVLSVLFVVAGVGFRVGPR